MHRAGQRMKGIDRGPPIIVRKCWNPRKRHMYQGGTSSILYAMSKFLSCSSFFIDSSMSYKIDLY